MHQAKPISKEEARYLFMKHIVELVRYWAEDSRTTDSRAKLEGLAFSILVTLDGATMGLPGYEVRPLARKDDMPFAIEKGFDYYPEESYDIADDVTLHDLFYEYVRGEIPRPENLRDFGAFLDEEAEKFRR